MEDKPAASTSSSSTAAPAAKSIRLDPKYKKFVTMIKMHMPEHVIKMKMKQGGVSDEDIKSFMEDKPAASSSSSSTATSTAPAKSFREDPKVKKFLPMLRMHLPPHVISAKMAQGGLSQDEINAFLNDKPLVTKAAPPAKSFREDPKCDPFVKMLKLHMPPHVVKGKMKMKGFSGAEIEAFLNDTPLPSSTSDKKDTKKGKKKGGKKKTKDPFKPKRPMKAFFWSKLDEKKVEIEKTIFKDLHALEVYQKFTPAHLQILESSFAKPKKKEKEKKQSVKKEEKPKELKAGIITGDRNRNVGIAISRIRVKYVVVIFFLLFMNIAYTSNPT